MLPEPLDDLFGSSYRGFVRGHDSAPVFAAVRAEGLSSGGR
jgi:hypothetical protein